MEKTHTHTRTKKNNNSIEQIYQLFYNSSTAVIGAEAHYDATSSPRQCGTALPLSFVRRKEQGRDEKIFHCPQDRSVAFAEA